VKILSLYEDDIARVLFPEAESTLFNTDKRQPLPNLEGYNLVIFAGGTDISTMFYGENAVYTESYWPSTRDIMEQAIFMRAWKQDISMLGICRGAQLLHALNGGALAQHIEGHPYKHHFNVDGKAIIGNTTHHQALMTDFNIGDPDEIIQTEVISKAVNEFGSMPVHNNIEICYWSATRSLCIQGHPEYEPKVSPWHQYCVKLIEDYLL